MKGSAWDIMTNILEYIDNLIEQGYTEAEAEMFADIAFNIEYEPEEV